MFLLELVMQGVRGVRQLVRLRFQGGFNFVAAGNEAGKTTAVDAMMHLLFPSNQAGTMESLVSRYTPEASRSALVVFSDDKTYCRVIEDFSKRAVNLSKYNESTKDFTLLYKDWDTAAQFMAGLTAGVPAEEYAGLFVLRREHFGGQAASPGASAARPGPVASPVIQPKPAASAKSPAQDARLAELRETLRKAEEAADAEYRLDSAKLRLGDIRKKLETLEDINARHADIESNLTALKGCEELPGNLAELIDAHEQHQGEKMSRSEELQRDIEGLRTQIENMPKASLWTDPLFLLGALLAIGSVVAGLSLLTTEQADYFMIGVLVSVAFMSVAWYKSSRKNAQRKVVAKEKETLEAEREEIEKSFEQGGGEIMALMTATASTTTAELKDKADNYRYFSSLAAEIEDQRRALLGDSTVEALRAEYTKQQQEVIEFEKAARAVSQYAVDTYSIRQEIERIESESSGPAIDFGSYGSDLPSDFGTHAASPGGSRGIFLPELAIASRIGGIEMETLVPAVEAAAQRNLSAITVGRYVRVEAGHDGDPAVYDKDDVKLKYEDLSHSTRELLYFCLRTGLAEALAGKLRLPLILDDPLAGFDPARQQAGCQILRALGAKTQVILFTSNPSLKADGDVVAELK